MVCKRTLAPVGLLGMLALCGTAHAQENDTLERLRQQLEQQCRTLEVQQREIDAQMETLEQTRQELDRLQSDSPASAQSRPEPAPAPASTEPDRQTPARVGQAPQQQPAAEIAPVLEQPGVLTPGGAFVLEPSLQYAYTSNSRVALIGFTIIPAITVGLIDVREVNRSTLIGALTARYGLTNRLELETRVPYVYRNDDAVTRPLAEPASGDRVFNTDGHGLGDVEVALRYQFNQGGADFPYFIGSLRGIFPTGEDPFEVDYAPTGAGNWMQETLPTGSGFYGVQPGLIVIFPSDPAVFFGGINYLWNIPRDVDERIGGVFIGEVDPGDAISVNFGMGLALNQKSSFSVGYQHTYVGKTEFDGQAPSDATSMQLGELLFGYAYRLSDNTNLNLTLGAGLTRNAPDVEIILRLPITF